MGASGCVWSCTARIQGIFFVELVQTCDKEKLPILVGVTSISSEILVKKNNNKFNGRWPFLFNTVIDGLDLRELEMSGRKYTCQIP